MIEEILYKQAVSRAVEAKNAYMRKALREDNLFHYLSFRKNQSSYKSKCL